MSASFRARLHPRSRLRRIERSADEQSETGGGVPDRRCTHRREQAADRSGTAKGLEQLAERRGGEVGERVAVGKHHAPDARGVAVEQELADGASGVVADEGHVVELQRLEKRGDLTGDTPRGLIRVGAHGDRVRAERPVGGVGANARVGERRGGPAPQRPTDQEAVHEDDWRPHVCFGAGDAVLHDAMGKFDRRHVCSLV